MSDSTASINTGANGAENTGGFKPVTSQEDLDRIIENRLVRERRKLADYDQLKEQAGKLSGLQAKLEEAEAKVSEFKERDQIATWKHEVAKETGVPESVLRGSTLDDIKAHAQSLKEVISSRPVAPVVRGQGDQPSSSVSNGQRLVRELFGRD